jgi:single-strand DNA-binding protein
MASLNSVHLIGRLTRDPEIKTFQNGGKVAQFGFAVDSKKKNQQTGAWENDPVFLDLKAFNSQHRKTADLVEKYLRKGMLVFVDGRLTVERWEDKNGGGKRSATKIIVDNVQFLEKRDQSQNNIQGQPDQTQMPSGPPPADDTPPPSDSYDDPGSIPF